MCRTILWFLNLRILMQLFREHLPDSSFFPPWFPVWVLQSPLALRSISELFCSINLCSGLGHCVPGSDRAPPTWCYSSMAWYSWLFLLVYFALSQSAHFFRKGRGEHFGLWHHWGSFALVAQGSHGRVIRKDTTSNKMLCPKQAH